MSRKHYVAIAKILREAGYLTQQQREALAKELAGVMAQDNPAFSRDKFVTASKGD